MEDIKQIQEFFSKPLEENTFKKGDKVIYLGNPAEITFVGKDQMGRVYYSVSYDKGNGKTKASNLYNKGGEIKPLNENKVTKEDFDKVVKILGKSKYPFTIMLVPKWDEIDIITGQDSPDEIVDDIGQRLDSAGLNWGGNSGITISGDSSNYSRREYSDIFRVNGGHKDYYEESINEQADHVNPMVVKAYKDYIKAKKDSAADVDFAEDPEKAYRYYSKKLNNTYSTRADRDAIEAILKKKYGSAMEESVNEADLNDPILMKMRAAKDKLAKMRAANAGDDGNDKFFDNAKKIAFLKKERAQLMRDMEQEAEPEGGPIADEYGSKLNRIDAAIAKLSGRKEMDYDTAVGKVNEYDVYMPSQEEVDRFFELTNNETHYLYSKPVMGQEGTFNLMPIEPWDEYDYSNWKALVRKAKAKGKSLTEVKVDYDFSERELIRVLRQLKRGASTEIDMIKAFTKALGRDITKDELFSESIAENDSYARVSKPRFVKDKNAPNFLNVYIDYDLGPGGSSIALGKETMTGQIRRLSAAKAKIIAYDVARDLKAKYNLEDIDIQDLENGKVRIFAVSDDFIDMDPNMLSEASKGAMNYFSDLKYNYQKAFRYLDVEEREEYKQLAKDFFSKLQVDDKVRAVGLEEAKVEVVLSNQILDFLQQRNLITGVNAQKVHKDLTTFIKNIKINPNADLNEAKEEDKIEFKKGNTVFDKHTKAKLKVTRIVKDRIYTVPFNFPGRAEEWYKAEDLTTKSFFTEQKEDKIDIVTMDVPLFIRALEYAKEDAQEDMDLHDFAEKAIAATKEQGILQMDDYDMLVGGKEPIDESIAQTLAETIKLGEGVIEEELCPKGKAYIKRRKAAGEKSSAYLSGRAVKVCKGQMSGRKKKK